MPVNRPSRVVVLRPQIVYGWLVDGQVCMLDDTAAGSVMIITDPGPYRMHVVVWRERKPGEDREHCGTRGKDP